MLFDTLLNQWMQLQAGGEGAQPDEKIMTPQQSSVADDAHDVEMYRVERDMLHAPAALSGAISKIAIALMYRVQECEELDHNWLLVASAMNDFRRIAGVESHQTIELRLSDFLRATG